VERIMVGFELKQVHKSSIVEELIC
jgi:hypothetical protein